MCLSARARCCFSTSRFDPLISKGPRLLPSPFPLGTRGPLPRTARQEVKWRSLNAETACEAGKRPGCPLYPVLLYSRYSVGTVAGFSATFSDVPVVGGGADGGGFGGLQTSLGERGRQRPAPVKYVRQRQLVRRFGAHLAEAAWRITSSLA